MGKNYRNLYIVPITVVFMFILTSCRNEDQLNVRATAGAMANTMNALTHQAETLMITSTPIPSTTPRSTATHTPAASPTFLPTLTGLAFSPIYPPTATFTPAASLTSPPTDTSVPANAPTQTTSSVNTPAPTKASTSINTPTTDYSAYPTYTPLPFIAKNKYSTIRLVNSTGKQATVRLNGAQIYDATVGKSTIIKVRFDTYYFTIFIGKDGPYNGSIFINSADRYTIFIDEGNVRVATP